MKTTLTWFMKVTLSAFLLLITLSSSYAACDNPAYIEGADRTYVAGDIVSRNGKDYKVIIASWANTSASDFYYAPGTGAAWTQAWSLESDPCKDTGINTGTCSDGIQNQNETGVDCGGPCPACTTTATCSDGIQNQDETGIDCGGASCPACSTGGGGGGGGSSSCSSTKDDGKAEATFYTNLESGASNVVTCSFDAVNDVKGTFYGALETATLHQTPAKYCGMCVSMTGLAGTATVHVVDECPDCYHHNVGDTDIDLSPPAFAAVVGSQSIGRSPITWHEISCPWTTPIHIIVQGSNQWYCKVIVGNTVNRVAKVEVKNGGTYYELKRGVDNGWESTGSPAQGNINEVSKTFRVTDIYGEQIEVSGIDFSGNPTNSKTNGPSNFSSCIITSEQNINPLDYISVFPNPADENVTFEGIEGVTSITVYSYLGTVVGQQSLDGTTGTIGLDVANLAPGIYVAKFIGLGKTGAVTFVKR